MDSILPQPGRDTVSLSPVESTRPVMKTALLELLGSKKFIVLVATVIAYAIAKTGWTVDEAAVEKVLVLVAIWMGAQGLNDIGKAKAQIDAAATADAASKLAGSPGPNGKV